MAFSFKFENFIFNPIDSTSQLKQLMDFLKNQSLGYRNYNNWLERTEWDLITEKKKAILGFSGNILVADAIYRINGDVPGFLDFRNMRVSPEIERRYFGHFIDKQIEREGMGAGKYGTICDVRANQPELISFMQNLGYRRLFDTSRDLYKESEKDVVLVKFYKNAKEHEKRILDLARNKLAVN